MLSTTEHIVSRERRDGRTTSRALVVLLCFFTAEIGQNTRLAEIGCAVVHASETSIVTDCPLAAARRARACAGVDDETDSHQARALDAPPGESPPSRRSCRHRTQRRLELRPASPET